MTVEVGTGEWRGQPVCVALSDCGIHGGDQAGPEGCQQFGTSWLLRPSLGDARPWLALHPGGLVSLPPWLPVPSSSSCFRGGGQAGDVCSTHPGLSRKDVVLELRKAEDQHGSDTVILGRVVKLPPLWCGSPLPAWGWLRERVGWGLWAHRYDENKAAWGDEPPCSHSPPQ